MQSCLLARHACRRDAEARSITIEELATKGTKGTKIRVRLCAFCGYSPYIMPARHESAKWAPPPYRTYHPPWRSDRVCSRIDRHVPAGSADDRGGVRGGARTRSALPGFILFGTGDRPSILRTDFGSIRTEAPA